MMKLLTIREWIGPTSIVNYEGEHSEKLIGMATRLPLADSIRKLHEYEKWYRRKYKHTAVNFNLVSVSEIEEIDDLLLDFMRVELIETLEPKDE